MTMCLLVFVFVLQNVWYFSDIGITTGYWYLEI